jgi:hypothetical protein
MKRRKTGPNRSMTHHQFDNMMEWFQRMAACGDDAAASVVIFNGLTAQQQQKIIRNRWFDQWTAKPICRPLLPPSKVGDD